MKKKEYFHPISKLVKLINPEILLVVESITDKPDKLDDDGSIKDEDDLYGIQSISSRK